MAVNPPYYAVRSGPHDVSGDKGKAYLVYDGYTGSSTAVFAQRSAISFPSILTSAGVHRIVTLLTRCVRALADSMSAIAWRCPGLAHPAGPVELLPQIRRRLGSAARTCPRRRRFPASGEVGAAQHRRPPCFCPDGIFVLSIWQLLSGRWVSPHRCGTPHRLRLPHQDCRVWASLAGVNLLSATTNPSGVDLRI